MRRAWFLLMLVLTLATTWLALPAWALDAPAAVQALSSAGTPVGQAIVGADGRPYQDASGRPLMVTANQTDPAQATLTSLSTMMRVPVADLLAYTANLGISLPLMMTGTLTTVQRSDGGLERVFNFVAASGDTYVFLADQTGPNVYGIRIANVRANGMGTVLTAHGLNGNFTNPPSYLTPAARAQYWMNTQVAQVITPPPPSPLPTQPPPVVTTPTTAADARHAGGAAKLTFVSDTSASHGRLTLNGTRRAAVFRAR